MTIPLGVKIISILYYIGAVAALISGVMILFRSGTIITQVPLLAPLAGLLVIAGIIMIALAVLSFFIGKGLWKAQNWARIVAIIIAVIGLLSAIMAMVQSSVAGNIVTLIIHLIIGGYLLFSKSVKKTFK